MAVPPHPGVQIRVQLVVYCVLFIVMSTDIEKKLKIQLFQRRDVLTAYGFLSGRKLGQYSDQELLKPLSQNKTPDLSLKYILIQMFDQKGQQ